MKQCVFSLLFASSLMATSVQYSTNGVFTGPDAISGSLFNKGALVTFVNVAAVTVDSPTNISLGEVVVTPPTSGTAVFSNDSLALRILETIPSSGTGKTNAVNINGTIMSASDTLELIFQPSVVVIGNETYTLPSGPILLVAPDTNSGTTSIQASLVSLVGTTIPEPSAWGMVLTGLLGCMGGFWATRKRPGK